MSHTEACLFCHLHSLREGLLRALMDHRAVLKDQLKAPISFLAQASGFNFICNVCPILDLVCSLFTLALYGHSVKGDTETKQKLAS